MLDDTKAMVIAGCPVHLVFVLADGRWSVNGKVTCGLADNQREVAFSVGPCSTREEAEQKALSQAGQLLGHNVDRNTSRVNNWR